MLFSISGTDSYRVKEKLNELKAEFAKKRDQSGLNVINLDGEDLDIDQFTSEVMATPFLGEKKMVIVKNIFKNRNKKINKDVADFLKKHTTSQSPSQKDEKISGGIDNVVGFVNFLDPEKYKGKTKLTGPLVKLLASQKFYWEFDLLTYRSLNIWIKKYCDQNGVKIENRAVDELAAMVGNDLEALVLEINKLKAYCNDKIIATDNVKKLVNAKFDENIFNLVDALGQKNQKLALKLTADQLNSGNHELMILKMIIRQFKILLQVKNSGPNIKMHPFVLQKAKNQANNFSHNRLKWIYQELIELEIKMKSGYKNPELLFDLFITNLSTKNIWQNIIIVINFILGLVFCKRKAALINLTFLARYKRK